MTVELACIRSKEETMNRNMHTKTCINTDINRLKTIEPKSITVNTKRWIGLFFLIFLLLYFMLGKMKEWSFYGPYIFSENNTWAEPRMYNTE